MSIPLVAGFPIPDRPSGGWDPLFGVLILGLLFLAALAFLIRTRPKATWAGASGGRSQEPPVPSAGRSSAPHPFPGLDRTPRTASPRHAAIPVTPARPLAAGRGRPEPFAALLMASLVFGAAITRASGLPAWVWVACGAGAAGAGILALVAWRADDRRTPQLLLVGEPGRERSLALSQALDDRGYDVRTCPGPERRDCPVFRGEPCDVKAHPVMALICQVDGGGALRAPCGEALGVPDVRLDTDRLPSEPGLRATEAYQLASRAIGEVARIPVSSRTS